MLHTPSVTRVLLVVIVAKVTLIRKIRVTQRKEKVGEKANESNRIKCLSKFMGQIHRCKTMK